MNYDKFVNNKVKPIHQHNMASCSTYSKLLIDVGAEDFPPVHIKYFKVYQYIMILS